MENSLESNYKFIISNVLCNISSCVDAMKILFCKQSYRKGICTLRWVFHTWTYEGHSSFLLVILQTLYHIFDRHMLLEKKTVWSFSVYIIFSVIILPLVTLLWVFICLSKDLFAFIPKKDSSHCWQSLWAEIKKMYFGLKIWWIKKSGDLDKKCSISWKRWCFHVLK